MYEKEDRICGYSFEKIVLKYDCSGEIFDGYRYSQYILMKERTEVMENNNQGHTTNFNGSVTINGGVVGAIGGENKVQQNVNETNTIENFYRDVQSMNLEVLNNDSEAVELAKKLKMRRLLKIKKGY